MDPKALEQIKDVRTCIKVSEIIHAVKPEWDFEILKYCMELAAPTRKTEEPPTNKTQTK